MALHEYPEGDPFPGSIGVTSRESTPAWPGPRRAADGAPNVMVVVLDDVGFAQLGCYGSDIDTPTFDRLAAGGLRYTQLPHHRALLADARRACSPAATTTPSAWARVAEIAIGFPGYNGAHPARERVPARDAARPRLRDVRDRQVAPHARPSETHRARRASAGRSAAVSTASTASSTARPTSAVPTSSTTTTTVDPPATPRRGLPPDRGPRRPGDRDASTTCAPPRPTSRSSSTSRSARATHRTTSAGVHRSLPRAVRRGLGRWREERLRAPAGVGLVPPSTPSSRARPSWVRGVGRRSRTTSSRLYARMMEVFAGVPDAHRPPRRPHDRLPRRARRARQHAGAPRRRTTARAQKVARTAP